MPPERLSDDPAPLDLHRQGGVEAGETWQGIPRGERRARKIHLPPRGPQEGSESHPRSPQRRPKKAHCSPQESPALAPESFEIARWNFTR